ncbi:MAG: hypothetical protein OXG06_01360 [Gammaproteobacteria bacterium]|nr:hypothetical protein [Gammaproteobacteria bacterium]
MKVTQGMQALFVTFVYNSHPNTLTVSEDPAPDLGVDGWMGNRVMKTVEDDANPEAGIIYTNLAAPTPTKLTQASGITVDADNPATITEPDNVASYAAEAELMGTFRGVAGTFTCETAGCTITRDDDGDITSVSSEWSFESTDPVDSLAVQATDYLFFGAWLVTTPDDDANMFKVFAGGDIPRTDVASLVGSAVYEGAAAGMYATKENEIKPDGTVGPVAGSVMAGEFVAKARLTANFGGTGLAEDDHYKITGAIYDFMDGNQMLDFMVNLSTALGDGSSTRTAFGTPSASASFGTNPSTSASWSYGFFGSTTDADGAAITPTPLPSGIAGVFDAHFANGHVAGGFGATR